MLFKKKSSSLAPPPTFSSNAAPSGVSSNVEPITLTVKPSCPEIPVLDSYQSNTNCIIVLYTKLKSLRKESIVLDKPANNNNFLLFLYSPDAVYKYELGEKWLNFLCFYFERVFYSTNKNYLYFNNCFFLFLFFF